MRLPNSRQLASLAMLLVLAAACKKKGTDGPTGPGPTPTIAVSVNPGAATVLPGGSTQTTATLTRGGGFTGTVNLTAEGAPAGVTATIGTPQTSGTTTNAPVTVQVGTGVAPGSYPIVLRGQGTGVAAATATFQLTVEPTPDYALGVAPGTVSLVQGATRNDIAISLTRTNFTGAVTLALGGTVPAGVTATFAPAAPTATTATMTLVVGESVTPGTYTLTVAGTAAPGARSTPFVLTVTQAGSFGLGMAPVGAVTLQPGTSDASRTITITRTNYPPEITLVAEGLPTGVTASFAPDPIAGNSTVMTLTAAANAPTGGPHTITIRGTGPLALRVRDANTLDATAALTFQLSVIPLGSFALGLPAACAANFEIRQGGYDDRRIITITRTNYAAPIQFSLEGAPPGLTVGFDANPVTGNAVRLRFTPSPSVPAAIYPMVLRATGPGSTDKTIPLSVDVRTPFDANDPNQLDSDFTSGADGWMRGMVCPFPTGGDTHVDWGAVFFQEQMFGIDGRGPASNRQEPNSWVSRVINLPAGASKFQFVASGHFLNDARAKVRIRVVDGTTSTVILTQTVVGSFPVRVFQTLEADISPWAGKTVRILVEHLDDLASHGQLWLDTFRIVVVP